MTAFIQIGYNEIPRLATSFQVLYYNAASVLVGAGPNELPIQNLFFGGSSIFWRNSDTQAIAKTYIRFNLPTSKTINYIALRGLNLMFASGSGNITLDLRINLGATVATVTINSASLVGPYLEDYIFTFPETAAATTVELYISSVNEIPHRLRKLYIGKLFDFGGASPYYPYTPEYGENGTPFTSDAGTLFKTSVGRVPRILEFNWRGISDANRIIFAKQIKKYLADYPIFLYEPPASDHSPLDGDRLIYGWAQAKIGSKDWKNNNQLNLSFREDIVG